MGKTEDGFGSTWKQQVAEGAGCYGLDLDGVQLDMMAFHASEMIRWNRRFNITAITDPREVAVKHFVDALALVPRVPPGGCVVDLGSGGGFPGLPLCMCRPDVQVVMVDAVRKKVGFISHVIRSTKLTRARAVHGRVEALGRDDAFKGRFDLVVSRAFTALDRFVKLALPFLAAQGKILAMKGSVTPEEIGAVDPERFRVTVHAYDLPLEAHQRTLVQVEPL